MKTDWKAIREEYVERGASVRHLANRFCCKEAEIRTKAKRQGWKRRKKREKAGIAEATFNGPETEGINNKTLWNVVKTRLVKSLENGDVKEGFEELKFAKVAGEVLSCVIKGELIEKGMEDKGPMPAEDTEETAREMAEATISRGTDETMDRG